MAKKNQIKFGSFLKAVDKYLAKKFYKHLIIPKSGSGIRFEVFDENSISTPSKMWVVHRDRYVHKGDLKKTCMNLGLDIGDFIKLL